MPRRDHPSGMFADSRFLPAQRLYQSFGFTYCGPFAPYVPDPHSVFMTLELQTAVAR